MTFTLTYVYDILIIFIKNTYLLKLKEYPFIPVNA